MVLVDRARARRRCAPEYVSVTEMHLTKPLMVPLWGEWRQQVEQQGHLKPPQRALGQHQGLERCPQHAKGPCPPSSLPDIGWDRSHPTHETFREAKAGMISSHV